jgi:hypothetical protein
LQQRSVCCRCCGKGVCVAAVAAKECVLPLLRQRSVCCRYSHNILLILYSFWLLPTLLTTHLLLARRASRFRIYLPPLSPGPKPSPSRNSENNEVALISSHSFFPSITSPSFFNASAMLVARCCGVAVNP